MVPSGPKAKRSLHLTIFSQTLFTRPLGKEVPNGEEFYRAEKCQQKYLLLAVDFSGRRGGFHLKCLLNLH